MKHKNFVIITLTITLISISLLSQLVKYSTIMNPLYKKSQKRISESKINNEIVFVGDSSLEYGLDPNYFSKLTKGIKVSNLALTAGPHNFSATYNMIRHTLENNKNVKYIIIMQTPLVWYKEFVLSGYCSTLNHLDSNTPINIGLLDTFDCFKYHYFNIKSIYETFSQIYAEKKAKNEPMKTYKNGGLNIFEELNINKFSHLNNIGSTKIKEIGMIDDYLIDKKIKVFYIQGSLHYQLSLKYSNIIKEQQKILKNLKNIIFIEQYLYPKNENMGNSVNHVDKSYMYKSTEFYFSILKEYIK